MGWSFGWHNRRSLISELTKDNDFQKCIAKCYRGNVHSGILWSVWEYTKPSDKCKEGYRWIKCDILQYRGGDWGYKDLCESMHPYYYSCPVGYLKMTENFVECKAWRDEVMRLDEIKKRQSLQAKMCNVGDKINFKGCSIPYAFVTRTKPLMGSYRGVDYKIVKKFIDVDLVKV